MPVLCEGTNRMTWPRSDCTSKHGKNYFDSRLMSDMGILRQLWPPSVELSMSISGCI